MAKNRDKFRAKKGRRASVIGYGASVLLYALFFPLYRLSDWLLCSALALLIGKVVGVMAQGPDLTTHNKPQPNQRGEMPVEELPLSGNADADEVIAKGQQILHQIRAENDAIADEVLSGQMDELERLCAQIFKTVAEKPNKAPQIRKFMNYYLPTTLKMLGSYHTMDSRGVSVTDMTHARSETIRGMNMILTACQKQLDNLYKDTMLDVSTDIDVLEQMLRRDGLTDGAFSSNPLNGSASSGDATAAAAQMNATRPPVLNTQSSDDDFVSFYSQQRNSNK